MSDKLDAEIQADAPGVTVSTALCATPLAWSGIHNVVRKLNRDITLVATGLLGTIIFAAIVLAFLGRDPKAEEGPKGARRTAGKLLLGSNPVTYENVMGSNGKNLGELAWGFNSGISYPEAVGTAASGIPASTPGSSQVIRQRIPKAKYRPSVRHKRVDVRTRLIALWRQSLKRRERSGDWTAFSNVNR